MNKKEIGQTSGLARCSLSQKYFKTNDKKFHLRVIVKVILFIVHGTYVLFNELQTLL